VIGTIIFLLELSGNVGTLCWLTFCHCELAVDRASRTHHIIAKLRLVVDQRISSIIRISIQF
jgi:hypothetical protein